MGLLVVFLLILPLIFIFKYNFFNPIPYFIYSIVALVILYVFNTHIQRTKGKVSKKLFIIFTIIILIIPIHRLIIYALPTLEEGIYGLKHRELTISFDAVEKANNWEEIVRERDRKVYMKSRDLMKYQIRVENLPTKLTTYYLSISYLDNTGMELPAHDRIIFSRIDDTWHYSGNFVYRENQDYIPLPENGLITRYVLFDKKDEEKIEDVFALDLMLENNFEESNNVNLLWAIVKLGETTQFSPNLQDFNPN